jgi:methionyl-tRNA formyltransferase
MGTGPFAVPTFDRLVCEHDVLLIVTRPIPPAQGKRKAPANPVREHFVAGDIPLMEPQSVNDPQVIEQLAALGPDVLVVCDYGQILSAQTLQSSRLGGINLHGSLLPKYRGAAPVNWAIWNGDSETGVTVIHMSPRLDAGPCLAQVATPIGREEDAGQLEQRLAQLGVEPVLQALEMLANWDGQTPIGEVQDPALASKAPRLKKSDGLIDWSQSAGQISNQVRALSPWPGTYTQWLRDKGEVRLILRKVSVSDQTAPPGARPGQVVACEDGRLILATGSGCLEVHQVQPAGKRVMPIGEFLRGYPTQCGHVPVR